MDKAKVMKKLLVEHERMETPKQEKSESKQVQTMEKQLGIEKKRGGKIKKGKK